MDALEMLANDHQHVRQLLKQLMITPAEDPLARQGLVERLRHDLSVHSRLEEEVFYPALARAGGQPGEVMRFEALEEHRMVDKQALPDLANTPATDAAFEGRAKALKELIEHHIGEEEREMFPLARQVMTAGQINEMGHRMGQLRAQWFAQGWPNNKQSADPVMGDTWHWFSDRAHTMEEQGWLAASEFAQDPARSIGRGVERAVGMGARLAGEVFGGIRRGLDQAGKRDKQPHD